MAELSADDGWFDDDGGGVSAAERIASAADVEAGGAGLGSMATSFMGNMVSNNLASGRSLATKYGRIDTVREFFDVDPAEVLERLVVSVHPLRESGLPTRFDLYGPLMSVLTLGCFIVVGMQSAHVGAGARGGTVLGAALFVCFAYWCLASGLFLFGCRLCDTPMPLLPIVSIVGYGFFGVSCGFAVGLISPWQTLNDFVLLVFAGLSAVSMGRTFSHETPSAKKVVIGAGVAGTHFVFAWYLRLFYVKGLAPMAATAMVAAS